MKLYPVLLLIALPLPLVGCGRADRGGGQVGMVRYESHGLANVQVTWHRPAEVGFEPIASAVTQADGKFRLVSPAGAAADLPPGKYRVTLEHVGDTTWSFLSRLSKPESSPLDIDVTAASELVVDAPPRSVIVAK